MDCAERWIHIGWGRKGIQDKDRSFACGSATCRPISPPSLPRTPVTVDWMDADAFSQPTLLTYLARPFSAIPQHSRSRPFQRVAAVGAHPERSPCLCFGRSTPSGCHRLLRVRRAGRATSRFEVGIPTTQHRRRGHIDDERWRESKEASRWEREGDRVTTGRAGGRMGGGGTARA